MAELDFNGDKQNEDYGPLLQPMVTKLCRLLSQYSIEIIPPQKGDKELVLSLTSPSMPEIMRSILADNTGFAKTVQLPAPDPAQKVFTINQQLITKVYTRKKLKIKSQQARVWPSVWSSATGVYPTVQARKWAQG
jgi:hypothetical protein